MLSDIHLRSYFAWSVMLFVFRTLTLSFLQFSCTSKADFQLFSDMAQATQYSIIVIKKFKLYLSYNKPKDPPFLQNKKEVSMQDFSIVHSHDVRKPPGSGSIVQYQTKKFSQRPIYTQRGCPTLASSQPLLHGPSVGLFIHYHQNGDYIF